MVRELRGFGIDPALVLDRVTLLMPNGNLFGSISHYENLSFGPLGFGHSLGDRCHSDFHGLFLLQAG